MNLKNKILISVRTVKYLIRAMSSKRKLEKQIVYLCPNKMGSTTFGNYFKTRGYSVYHGGIWRFRYFWKLNRNFDVLCDGLPENIEDFIRSLPKGTVVIVGKRDEAAWLRSRVSHIEDNSKKWIYFAENAFWSTDDIAKANWSRQYSNFYSQIPDILGRAEVEWHFIHLVEHDKDSMVHQLDCIFGFDTNTEDVISNSYLDRRKVLLYERNPFHFETLCSVINKWPDHSIDIYAPFARPERGQELIEAAIQKYPKVQIVSKLRLSEYDEIFINTFDSKSGLIIAIMVKLFGYSYSGLVHNFKFLNETTVPNLPVLKRMFAYMLIRVSMQANAVYTLSSKLDYSFYRNRNIVIHEMTELEKYALLSPKEICGSYYVIVGGFSELKKDYDNILKVYKYYKLQGDVHFLGEYVSSVRTSIRAKLKEANIECHFYDRLGDLDFLKFVSRADGIIDVNRIQVYGVEKVSAQSYLSQVFRIREFGVG